MIGPATRVARTRARSLLRLVAPPWPTHPDLGRREAIMRSRVTLFGHPVHPMLVVLPLALFAVAVLADVAYLVTGDDLFAAVAFANITVGLIGGLLAALAGVVDWLAIPRDTRPRRLGAWHGIGNLVIVLLFAGSWALRFGEPAYGPDILPFILGAIGVLLALGTAWLGGELVYRHGIGVDPLPGDDPALADGRRRPADDRAGRPA
jgi:uncharacterized membrane protein